MKKLIEIYTKDYCPYCVRAKQLLETKGVSYTEHDLEKTPSLVEEMVKRSKRKTVPQIFIGGEHIGGCDDLYALEQQGILNSILN